MLLSQLKTTLSNTALIAPEDRVMVAFSGGPDSTALLLALFEIQSEFEFSLCAAHINHMLRGSDSDADQLWSAELCRSLDIQFRSKRIDIGGIQAEQGGNLEEIARDQRYGFLQQAAEEMGANRIAVAHTQDDQAETVLLRLVRGAGRSGLRGMRQMRSNIIRPLLDVTRDEVEQFLADRHIVARQDLSNKDQKFSRVLIRRSVTPLLKQINPSVSQTISTAAEILGDEDDFLNSMADTLLPELVNLDDEKAAIAIEPFRDIPLALQRRLLRRTLLRLLGSLRRITSLQIEKLRRVILNNETQIAIEGFVTNMDGEHLLLTRQVDLHENSYSYSVATECEVSLKEVDKSFRLRIIDSGSDVDIRTLSNPKRALMDADKVGAEITIRNWLPGDRFSPFGLSGSQKLQDAFINAKIDASQKAKSPVFLANGRICWVYGLRVDNDFRVTESTKRILVIEEVTVCQN